MSDKTERDRILQEIASTIEDWSYSWDSPCCDVVSVLINLGSHIISTGGEDPEVWINMMILLQEMKIREHNEDQKI